MRLRPLSLFLAASVAFAAPPLAASAAAQDGYGPESRGGPGDAGGPGSARSGTVSPPCDGTCARPSSRETGMPRECSFGSFAR
jgi:hypothetical protein